MRIGAVALTAILPGFNEVTAPLVILTLAALIIGGGWQQLKTDRFLPMLLGIAVVLTAVELIAPGNAVRSGTYPDIPTRHNVEFALVETLRQTGRFFANVAFYPALWIAAVAAWRMGARVPAFSMAGIGGIRCAGVWVVSLLSIVYLTLFPLYWEYGETNYTGEGRTYNITYFAFCAVFTLAVVGLLHKASERWPALATWPQTRNGHIDLVFSGALALLLVSSPVAHQAVRSLGPAPAYAEAHRIREAILRAPEHQGSAVVVNKITIQPPDLFWGDLQREEDNWINACAATYYGVASVRTLVADPE